MMSAAQRAIALTIAPSAKLADEMFA